MGEVGCLSAQYPGALVNERKAGTYWIGEVFFRIRSSSGGGPGALRVNVIPQNLPEDRLGRRRGSRCREAEIEERDGSSFFWMASW